MSKGIPRSLNVFGRAGYRKEYPLAAPLTVPKVVCNIHCNIKVGMQHEVFNLWLALAHVDEEEASIFQPQIPRGYLSNMISQAQCAREVCLKKSAPGHRGHTIRYLSKHYRTSLTQSVGTY